MAYQAPICCGNNLTADISIAARISANGKPAMRSLQVFSFTAKYLFCKLFKRRYSHETDDKGRIVKGDDSFLPNSLNPKILLGNKKLQSI
ncbi:hypothetical protein [Paenibacillus periandrae]|uniref:hypothetical protein n=1 Tax=Paenibacillus periandrae TaxID=1761741 RepID=UPI001F099312|nr:hypothetical protein [Paenibacillus periandrae]